jgi:hypothetical protein
MEVLQAGQPSSRGRGKRSAPQDKTDVLSIPVFL